MTPHFRTGEGGGRNKGGVPSIWTEDQTGILCGMVANGRSFADVAKALPFSQRQCSDRFKTIRRGFGWQAS